MVFYNRNNTIKILDGDKVLYELNYTANETITYEESAQSYAVSGNGNILAIVVWNCKDQCL